MCQKKIVFVFAYFVIVLPVRAGFDITSTANGRLVGMRSNQSQVIEAGKSLQVSSDEPQMLEFSDRMPVLLVPFGNSSEVKIDSPQVDATFNRRTQEEASKLLSPLMSDVVRLQSMIQKKQFKEAREKMTSLKTRYPEVPFLEFMWGSLLAVTGDRDGARKAIERGLAAHPDYEDGQVFLKRLKGER